ncbi:two component, sigma54 specific, transcriptional regulator, Fis family [Solidesulfovibrio carbinoliphilus subsp. oakridgensis]|uniref:Two component, sigma54 specific, transcriptional regulator, Fis family n=1 Tax=Solidesulfovibrio carbinoliphilus subsp. oakridgensis TaxID=694327 RepID=G7QCR8_9BACT|nr:sigma-54 dependent transcriptional regulator [Solidesulfovibrio carbinoliphilus]EHJ46224.1 two component, sigma54 specific, transcriptional regulator, Fis family [Solidesulfovibrio carbinoliphilus subsp. oakridgensis]
MAEKTILFVAPAQAVTRFFPFFKEAGVAAGIADSLPAALAAIRKSPPCLIFSQAKIGIYTAESLLAEGQKDAAFPPVIVFADRGTAAEASRCLELGARDYWLEPLSWEKIQAVLPAEAPPAPVPAAPALAPAAPARRPEPATDVQGKKFSIVGEHPLIRRVLGLARQVARSKATVLISGESGTGKEMFARYLHACSDRAEGPFVAINCAALPEHLLESELFGHEKGSFTGAIARKLGKFEMASGGTILLDEISEMDLGLQAKLLRVLQESEFDRVGGTETVQVDVRVLATTNRRLEEAVAEGKFRQDLYYRLNVIPLKLPPLRDRGEDVPRLALFFVDKFRKAYGLSPLTFSADAKQWLMAYDWPGNVRELQNLMERAVLLAGDGPIRKAHFLLDGDNWQEAGPEAGPDDGFGGREPGAAAGLAAVAGEDGEGDGLAAAARLFDRAPADVSGELLPLDVMERHMIIKSLDRTEGNRTQAAQLLGISVRTLRNKLNEYRKLGIEVP